nr:putative reverse transcriptase domain-containing protein [Tanacetum cinerariifolium]
MLLLHTPPYPVTMIYPHGAPLSSVPTLVYPEYLTPSNDDVEPGKAHPLQPFISPIILSLDYVADFETYKEEEDPEEDPEDELSKEEDLSTLVYSPSARLYINLLSKAVAPTPPLPPPFPLSPLSSPLPKIPSPPLLLPPPTRRDIILEANMLPQKRARFVVPSHRFEIGEIARSFMSITRMHKMIDPYYGLVYLHLREKRYHRSMDIAAEQEATYARRAWTHSMDCICELRSEIRVLQGEKMTSTRTSMIQEALEELITQRVADALATYDTNRSNGDDSHDLGSGRRRTVYTTRLAQWFKKMEFVFHISKCTVEFHVKFATCTLLGGELTWGNSHVRTVRHDAAYAFPWKTLMKMITENYCSRNESNQMEKYTGGLPDNIQGGLLTYACRQTKNKRKIDNNSRNNQAQQPPYKRQNVARAYVARPGERRESPNVINTQSAPGTVQKTAGNDEARRRAYALGGGEPNPDLNVVTELGSFNAIIGMYWLSKYHAVIICDEKIVRIPYGDEALIVQRDKSDGRNESWLNIISCTKTQKYFLKGCHVFLARIMKKKTEDKSEEKQPEDVPVVRDFLEVFPDDLLGVPPTRQVEFQINLVPSSAPVARAPYRLALSKMKESLDKLQELSDKGFIRPCSSPWGTSLLFVKKKDGLF